MSRSGGFSRARLGRFSSLLRGHVERGEIAGVVGLVCRRDEVHVEVLGAQDLASGAPMRRDTIVRIASMTKPVTAAAAMILVEEGRLRLDDPVDGWLPELGSRKVLRSLDSALDDTVPAKRSITVRDLITFRMGFGLVMELPGRYPIQRAMAEAGLSPGFRPITVSSDAYLARLGALPLVHQPGERWMYHTGSEVLGVLVARASGKSLGAFLEERIFAPLGMKDTAFSVPETKLDRLSTCYQTDAATGRLAVLDEARGGLWSRPPAFESGGAGLVSTADDFLAFARMLRDLGRHGAERILSRPAVELMTMDHLTPEQKAASPFTSGFWDRNGWGFGVAVTTRRDDVALSPGSYGWDGGLSTSFRVDPREELVTVSLVQRSMTRPDPEAIHVDFRTLAYQAIDD